METSAPTRVMARKVSNSLLLDINIFLFEDANIKDPDDLVIYIFDRLIGCDVPVVHNIGSPDIGFSIDNDLVVYLF